MTEQEFWESARRFQWALTPLETDESGSVVRCERGFCPLGAVLHAAGKANIHLPGPSFSADRLALPHEFTIRVMNGADRNGLDRPWLLKNLGVGSQESQP